MTEPDIRKAGSDTQETKTHETEAELRISRVQALNGSDLVSMVTYLLAKHPDTFPAMLDDALSGVSSGAGLAAVALSQRDGGNRINVALRRFPPRRCHCPPATSGDTRGPITDRSVRVNRTGFPGRSITCFNR